MSDVSGKMDAKRLAKWKRNIEIIYKDLVGLMYRRQMFEGLRDIAKDNPKLQEPSLFTDWMVGNYTSSVAAGIRRHTDTDPRNASLHNLIQEIIDHPRVITRSIYTAMYPSRTLRKHAGHSAFDEFAGGNGDYLDLAILQADLKRLDKACKPVRKYVNESLAHLPAKTSPVTLTFKELHDALDSLAGLIKKYKLMVKAVGAEVDPALGPWQNILTFPWIDLGEDAK